MKKILVPVDFSPASRTGFESAMLIGQATQAEVVALNVLPKVEDNYPPEISKGIQQEVEKKYISRLGKFTAGYPNLSPADPNPKPVIHTLVRFGNTVDEIIATSTEYHADLIVIGTKAKRNLWEYLFGSIATGLLKKSTLPVLIVPEGFRFESPKEIALANDFMTDAIPLNRLSEFAAVFGANIRQVHINILPSDFSDAKEETIEIPESEFGDSAMKHATVIRDISVKRGLDYFVQEQQIDLLALYLPQRSFFENLMRKSVSKQLVLDSKIPLLVFKD